MSFYVTRPRAALVALAMLFGLLVPATLAAEPASAALVPSTELLANGSFETGDFADWETKDMIVSVAPLEVLAAPDVTPTDGLFAVGHGLDGCGPDTIELWQDVSIPAGHSATLTFDWEINIIDHLGLEDATFDVVVEPVGDPAASTTIHTIAPLDSGSTNPQSSMLDMSTYADSTIRVKFVTTIPECLEISGDLQLDNVSLTATDIEAPVITLTGDNPQTLEVFSEYTELGATVSDNVDADVAIDGDFTAVALNVLGEYPVTYNAVDSSGNAAEQVIRTVEVVDTEAPVISLVGGTVTVGLGSTYIDPGASAVDNYDTELEVDINTDAVVTSEIGSYDVTFNVEDSSGNPATQLVRTVNVVDTTSPIITLVGGTQFIEFPAEYVEQGATVSDNYDTDLEILINKDAVNTLALGVYSVTYDATDSSGNPATQVLRTVRVVDTTRPVITLTGDNPQIIEVGDTYTELGATATDNHDTDLTVDPDAAEVTTSVVGTYSVFYTVTDAQGNKAATVARTVNVVDSEAPVITIVGADPQEIEVGDPYTELGATVTDNYDTGLTATADLSGLVIGTVGSYTVTYNAIDAGLNAALPVTRTVNVVDTEAPMLVLNGDPEVTVEVYGDYTEEGATATDNYDTELTVVIGDLELDTTVVGEYTVTYDVSDSSENAATQVTRTVYVVDSESPVITLIGGTPDGTQTIGVFRPYLELGSTVSDNYDNDLVATVDTSGLNTAVVGSYTVWYTAIDSSDNLAEPVARTVNVIDDGFPVITLLGDAEVTIEVGSGYDDEGAVADDVADGPLTELIIAFDPVNPDVVATYTVTYNVIDSDDNAATQVTRTVNVVDTTPPVITLNGANPQDIEVGTAYVELGADVSDNYDIGLAATVNTDAVLLDVLGEYIVTYNAIDANDNEADEVTRTVNVVDTTAPVITLVGDNPQVIEVGGDYVELGSTVSDNYDTGLVAVIDATDVDTDTVGEYTVTYNVTDANDNEADEVTRTVDVVDTTVPVITLTGATPVTIEVGSSYIDAGATASDIGDGDLTGAIVTVDPVDADVIGVYTVTYNVTDTSLNAAVEITRTVNVVDTTAPLVTLIGAKTVTVEVGSAYADAGATAVDLVDGDLTGSIVVTNPVKTNVVGVYVIKYDVSDLHGNPAKTVTRTVKVVDTTAPVITLVGDNPQVIDLGSAYVELGATATDNYDLGTSGIVIDATAVDPSKVGSYTVTYDVTDANLNAAVTVERTVSVVKAFATNIFIDDDGSAFEDDIDWLANSGITLGCNPPLNTLFCPNGSVTRGQMAAFLHRALPNLPEVRAAIDFTDDDASSFEADIEWLYSRGITSGTSATTYSPNATVTRGQMAAFLHRALPNLPEVRSAVDFTDDNNSTFEADIEWLYSRGITSGTSATTYSPNTIVTRAQMAAFLHRALG